MKEKNFDYVIHNMTHNGNVVDWLYSIKNFFGDEQTEAFCDYFIGVHQIIRKNDIRKILKTHSLSVYSRTQNEQLAFLSIYRPIDREQNIIKKLENGFEKAQKLYRNKDIKLSKSIKSLGYSYSTQLANWKDKNSKITYQKEYVFIIYSEKDSPEQFKNNILNLAKEYNIKEVLITNKLVDKSPKMVVSSKQYNVENGEIVKEIEDTTIETIENYLTEISYTKVLFEIPYENNKTILYNEEPCIVDYYSIDKQEKIKNAMPTSFNMGMLKQSLIHSFLKENYNN